VRISESGPQRAVADEPERSRRWVCKEGGKNVGVLDRYVTVAEEQVSRNAERWLLCSLKRRLREREGCPVGELEPRWKLPKKAGSHPTRRPCRGFAGAIENRFSMYDTTARKSFYGALVCASTALLERDIYLGQALELNSLSRRALRRRSLFLCALRS